MKITNIDEIKSNDLRFSDIEQGDTFLHDRSMCMKMHPDNTGRGHNYVNIETGYTGKLLAGHEITRINPLVSYTINN